MQCNHAHVKLPLVSALRDSTLSLKSTVDFPIVIHLKNTRKNHFPVSVNALYKLYNTATNTFLHDKPL